MTCPICRLRAWSRRKLQSSSKPWSRKASLVHALPHKERHHEPPPPYPNARPESIAGRASPEPLIPRDSSRAQNPVDVRMPPPPPRMPTPRTAADAAANCATLGMLHALAGDQPETIAIRAVRAMAVAISTSPSYAAFIAAAAAAESVASVCAEDRASRGNWPPDLVARRVLRDYNDALDTVMGPEFAGDTWPSSFNVGFHLPGPRPRPRQSSPAESTSLFKSSPVRQNPVVDITTNLIMSAAQGLI